MSSQTSAVLDPVEAQLIAYNARDVDKFMPCFTEDCVVEDGQGNVLMQGNDAMRKSYKAMFEANPLLHCDVVTRIRAGEYVVDEERVRGRGPAEIHVVVVYRLRSEQIAHVRILR
ncbi:MAG: nuclear transport factor 2 family protein [Sandaracinaceae bacterium]|jgi:hypothetical protein|nr:nuclear transport factor 2 family protein [Sandaracinaceae bacterium]